MSYKSVQIHGESTTTDHCQRAPSTRSCPLSLVTDLVQHVSQAVAMRPCQKLTPPLGLLGELLRALQRQSSEEEAHEGVRLFLEPASLGGKRTLRFLATTIMSIDSSLPRQYLEIFVQIYRSNEAHERFIPVPRNRRSLGIVQPSVLRAPLSPVLRRSAAVSLKS